jgi:hypothetical protein
MKKVSEVTIVEPHPAWMKFSRYLQHIIVKCAMILDALDF